VRVTAIAEPTPCDASRAEHASLPSSAKAWIRLGADPDDGGRVVASICYFGTLPLVQKAAPSASRDAEPRQLALAAAEALNGLRAKVPPLTSEPERPPATPEGAPPEHAEPAVTAANPLPSSLVLGSALVRNLPDFPAAPGVTTKATLGILPSFGIVLDVLVPTIGRELASEALTATLRTAWFRAGPRFGGALGDFELSALALAGPAITWATGVARPPRIGTTDVTTGAVLTLALSFEYPRGTPIFACASGAASALLPGVRVNLGTSADPPRGSFPLEASVGIGARFGGR
jgi:hypothetical protein